MKRKPTFLEGLSTIIALVLLMAVGCGVLNIAVQPLLLLTATYSFFIAKRLGYNWKELECEIIEKIKKAMPALLILVSVGVLVGTLIFAGTVPMLIYYGLKIISPKFFLVTAFLITAIVSVTTGTSWGSAGTAGVALIGVATGLGIPLPQAAGAIVSGAVFGDKMSPLSDTTNMAALATETNLYDHIKHMFYTTIPASIIAMIVWLAVGLKGVGHELVLPETLIALISTLDAMYNWNIVLLIPMFIVLFGAITGKPTVPTMLVASFTALVLGPLFHGFSIFDGIQATVTGFKTSMVNTPGFDIATAPDAIVSLLNRGGMMSMANMVLIIFCAMGYAGIVQSTGCLEVVLKFFESKIKSTGQLILVTITSSVILVSALGLASVSAIFIGELFTDTYKRRGLHTKNLSRTIEDAGTMIVSIIPWSGSGLFYLGTLGVPATQYAIWAIPCYLCIILATIYGFTGIGIAKQDYVMEEAEESK